MFLSPMKERYQSEVEIKQFDGKAVRALNSFMYCGEIGINRGNVLNLLAFADFLQMKNVKLFCFALLENNFSMDSCCKIIKLSVSCTTDTFKNLFKPILVSLISELISSIVIQSSVYNAILSWTHPNESRKVDFIELFLHLDLKSLSIELFTKSICKEPLVKQNIVCLNVVFSENLE